MVRLIARRLLIGIPMLLIVSFLVFVFIDLAPGDPAQSLAGDPPDPELVRRIRENLHLNDNLLVRYVRWLGDAVHGNLGKSFFGDEPVRQLIWDRASVTASIVFVTVVVTMVLSLILGTLAAMRAGKLTDRVVTGLASLGIAIPSLWLALVLVYQFAINRSWFPAVGYVGLNQGYWNWLQHLLLPALALAALPAAEMTLQLKSALVEVLGRDYLIAARAKGMRTTTLVAKHSMKNAAIPVVTVLGYRLAQLMGGTVIIETVFNINGIGNLAIAATRTKDIPVMLGLVVFTTTIVLFINVLVDISYGYFNPKVRK